MNNDRRKKLNGAIAALNIAKEQIESVRDEEQDSFDNMPEGMQQGERGEKMEEVIQSLDEAASALEDMIAQIEEAAE